MLRTATILMGLLIGIALRCRSNVPSSTAGQIPTNPSSQDTLRVGYTYWWPQDGPFIGSCGNLYALAFKGTVEHIQAPQADPEEELLYVSQRGFVRIDEVLAVRNLERMQYAGESIFTTDCFHGSGLKTGDQVLVFCSDYESGYSIPGKRSIVKISDRKDPLFKSALRFIHKGQNPQAIAKDLPLWEKHGHGEDLRRLLACKQFQSSQE